MLKVVLKKELKRVFTDRRLVFSTFILPALSIFIIYTIMGNMIGGMVDDIKEHNSIIYINNAPASFVDYYDSIENDYNANIEISNYDINEYKEDIRQGNIDLFVEFEEEFDQKISNYKESNILPEIMTYYNPSEEYSSSARNEFVYNILEGYQDEMLTERFGNLNYIKAFDIDKSNSESIIMDEKKSNSPFMSMVIPMLLAIILFAGAMGIGMDSIAGEKERGTMATLLLTPVSRETIAYGKIISLGIVAIVSAASSFIAIIASLPNMSSSFGDDAEYITSSMSGLSFSPLQYVQLFVVMITLVGIYVGLISLISVRARTVKEAGTYISPVYMVIMVAAFSSMYSIGKGISLYKFAIPVYGSISAIKKIFTNELSMSEFIVTSGVALLVTIIFVKLISNAFNDEKVMFNA